MTFSQGFQIRSLNERLQKDKVSNNNGIFVSNLSNMLKRLHLDKADNLKFFEKFAEKIHD